MEYKNRKRNRKKGFDYSSENIYFVTICIHEFKHYFGCVKNNDMHLNNYGVIASNQIKWLEQQYSYVIIHNSVIMPNHVHILFEIDTICLPGEIKIKSVSELIGAYKTTCSKQIHLAGNTEFRWHRSFHDHIVRSPEAYENIFNYITNNPARWHTDTHNDGARTDRS